MLDGLAEGGEAFVHVVGVKHLITLVSALVQLVLQVTITEVIQIQDTIDAHLMRTLLSLVELHLLPLLMGRRVAPPRAVHEQVFG